MTDHDNQPENERGTPDPAENERETPDPANSPTEQAKVREAEMEESGEENAA